MHGSSWASRLAGPPRLILLLGRPAGQRPRSGVLRNHSSKGASVFNLVFRGTPNSCSPQCLQSHGRICTSAPALTSIGASGLLFTFQEAVRARQRVDALRTPRHRFSNRRASNASPLSRIHASKRLGRPRAPHASCPWRDPAREPGATQRESAAPTVATMRRPLIARLRPKPGMGPRSAKASRVRQYGREDRFSPMKPRAQARVGRFMPGAGD